MGYYYAFGKDTDIDGNRYFIFNARSRLSSKPLRGLLTWPALAALLSLLKKDV
jgi:hypothetical protein